MALQRGGSMALKILIALVAIVAAFAAFVALQPSEYRIARSATIAAPASDVFTQVNDFHKWDAWSPWAKLDPNAKTTFEGTSAGEGAVFAWAGNSQIGEGRMTLTQSRPAELIQIKLDFVQPMAGTSTAELISLLSLSMISAGVAFGAPMPWCRSKAGLVRSASQSAPPPRCDTERARYWCRSSP